MADLKEELEFHRKALAHFRKITPPHIASAAETTPHLSEAEYRILTTYMILHLGASINALALQFDSVPGFQYLAADELEGRN